MNGTEEFGTFQQHIHDAAERIMQQWLNFRCTVLEGPLHGHNPLNRVRIGILLFI